MRDPSRRTDDTHSVTPAFSRLPPSLLGRHTSEISKREAGGNDRPSVCASRPVALQIAVISMPDLVPSRKLLNIFGLIEERSLTSTNPSRMSKIVSGVDW